MLSRTKAIRAQKRVTMTAAFLNTLGVISHSVLKDATNETVDQAKLEDTLRARLEPLRHVNWDREDVMWAGNLIVDKKVRTQTPALKAAADKLIELGRFCSSC